MTNHKRGHKGDGKTKMSKGVFVNNVNKAIHDNFLEFSFHENLICDYRETQGETTFTENATNKYKYIK